MSVDIDRATVLAHRVAAHGLDRRRDHPSDLAVLALGVQDTPAGAARLALAARLRDPAPVVAATDLTGGGERSLAWSVRGAPHLHRTDELRPLAAALWPVGDDDAYARMAATAVAVREAGIGGVEALVAVAEALRAVVTAPTTKGEASAAVTERVPAALSSWCRRCGATHVSDGLMRMAALPAGLGIEPEARTLTLAPVPGPWSLPARAEGTPELLRTYLRLHGPGTPGEAAGFLGTKATGVAPGWPADGLVAVRVEGRRTWFPEADLDALRTAEPAPMVRLLPPSDPWLQTRDRALLVPDPDHRKAVWRILGNPGALLVDGEVAGTWRARAAGGGRTALTVTPFRPLPAAVRAAVDDEADRVGAVRGTPTTEVRVEA